MTIRSTNTLKKRSPPRYYLGGKTLSKDKIFAQIWASIGNMNNKKRMPTISNNTNEMEQGMLVEPMPKAIWIEEGPTQSPTRPIKTLPEHLVRCSESGGL